MRRKISFIILFLAAQFGFAFTGCVRDQTQREMQRKDYNITFRVVDSVGGQVIEGVSANWRIITYLAPGDFTTEDQDLEKTNDLGLTSVHGVRVGHSFRFEKDGYIASRGVFSSEENIGLFYLTGETEGTVVRASETVKLTPDEPIVVKLFRRVE